jgi:hypothetical protein
MSVKLQNRREVEAHLQKFLDKMVLPPDMIGIITGKEVNEAYIGQFAANEGRDGDHRLTCLVCLFAWWPMLQSTL